MEASFVKLDLINESSATVLYLERRSFECSFARSVYYQTSNTSNIENSFAINEIFLIFY